METWSIIAPPEGSNAKPTIDVSAIHRKFLDVPYAAQSSSQKLDIYLPPEGEGPFPTVIFVHGGGFILGDKRDIQFLQAIDGINKGYAAVSLNYRLAPEATYPSAIYDVKAAIRFLRANAKKYQLDGERFALGGDSAGGHYAVMAAATQGNLAFEDLTMGNAAYSSAVSAVASRYGVYDFALESKMAREDPPTADPFFPDIELLLLGAHSEDISGLLHFTNPFNFIGKSFPPIFLEHGTTDTIVPAIHSYLMEEKVRTVCGPDHVELIIIEGYEHGNIDLRWAEPGNSDKMYAFFDKHLK